jgi:Flp pilus assembly protein TadG
MTEKRTYSGFMGRLAGMGRSLWRCRGGATAVEFAFVGPVFLIMVLGIVELGRAMWIKNTLQFAVEETSRYAMMNPSAGTSTLETYAGTKIVGSTVLTSGNFSASTETVSGTTYVIITGSYAFESLVPLVPIPAVTLSARSRVPVS